MESESTKLQKINDDFFEATEQFLYQLEANGYYDHVLNVSTPLEFSIIFGTDILNYAHRKLKKMNEPSQLDDSTDEKLKLELIEIVKEEQVGNGNDNNDTEYLKYETPNAIMTDDPVVSYTRNSKINSTTLTSVFENEIHEYSGINKNYDLDNDEDKDEDFHLKIDTDDEDHNPVNNNQRVRSNLPSDGIQVVSVARKTDETKSICQNLHEDNQVKKSVKLPDQNNLHQQVNEVIDNNQLIEKRVSRRIKQKINYAILNAGEESASSDDNLEIKKKQDNVQLTSKKIINRKPSFSANSYNSKKNNTSNILVSSKNISPTQIRKKKMRYIPIEMKERVVKLAQEHPDWSLRKIRRHSGCTNVVEKKILEKWSNQVQGHKGSYIDKLQSINQWVYKKYLESKKKNESIKISYETFKKWGLQAKKELFPSDKFKYSAANGWVQHFKKLYGIDFSPRKSKNCSVVQ